MFDIPGPTLLEDEPDTGTFDYANINGPVFFCNTVEHYLFIQELFLDAPSYFSQGRRGAHRFYTEFVTGKATLDQDDWAWDEFLAFLRLSKTPPLNVLLSTYWTMGAVRHGDYIAKVRITPDRDCAAAVVRRVIDPSSAQEVFRPALQAELQERPYAFDIQVQLCTDLERMPVEDTTVEWPERLSPSVTVARLRIPRQDISGPENLATMDSLSFTPWRVTAEHAPWATSCGPAKRSTVTPPSHATSSTSRHEQSRAAPTRYSARLHDTPHRTRPVPTDSHRPVRLTPYALRARRGPLTA